VDIGYNQFYLDSVQNSTGRNPICKSSHAREEY